MVHSSAVLALCGIYWFIGYATSYGQELPSTPRPHIPVVDISGGGVADAPPVPVRGFVALRVYDGIIGRPIEGAHPDYPATAPIQAEPPTPPTSPIVESPHRLPERNLCCREPEGSRPPEPQSSPSPPGLFKNQHLKRQCLNRGLHNYLWFAHAAIVPPLCAQRRFQSLPFIATEPTGAVMKRGPTTKTSRHRQRQRLLTIVQHKRGREEGGDATDVEGMANVPDAYRRRESARLPRCVSNIRDSNDDRPMQEGGTRQMDVQMHIPRVLNQEETK